ncbi:hypothetical protein D082_30960 [Synechocystis sp. PCC 6714]|nr:hypothetical protein D082_30960 [Synechocystis sp. PCC 6714]
MDINSYFDLANFDALENCISSTFLAQSKWRSPAHINKDRLRLL